MQVGVEYTQNNYIKMQIGVEYTLNKAAANWTIILRCKLM